MAITFELLMAEQALPIANATETQLNTLIEWCRKHLSQDCQFEGSNEAQYQQYLSFVKDYFSCPAVSIEQAALKGYDRIISHLSERKASFNVKNNMEMTPLHIAATHGHVHTVEALLAQGADPLIVNRQLQLPVHRALFVPARTRDTQLMTKKEAIFNRLLAAAPQTIRQPDKYGHSAIHLMASAGFDNLLAHYLTEDSSLFRLKNNDGHYPIHTAILNNRMNCASYLLTYPETPLLKDNLDRTALHYAAHYAPADMVAVCCEVFKDHMNEPDKEGRTALMLANQYNPSVQDTLIRYGADSQLPSHHYATTFQSSWSV